jgi:Family of unknown function (DUF5670)
VSKEGSELLIEKSSIDASRLADASLLLIQSTADPTSRQTDRCDTLLYAFLTKLSFDFRCCFFRKGITLKGDRRKTMLWTIFVILLVLWLLGFVGHVAGGLIHILLVVAVVVLIINLLTGRRAV